jgi:hypothetical protein
MEHPENYYFGLTVIQAIDDGRLRYSMNGHPTVAQLRGQAYAVMAAKEGDVGYDRQLTGLIEMIDRFGGEGDGEDLLRLVAAFYELAAGELPQRIRYVMMDDDHEASDSDEEDDDFDEDWQP